MSPSSMAPHKRPLPPPQNRQAVTRQAKHQPHWHSINDDIQIATTPSPIDQEIPLSPILNPIILAPSNIDPPQANPRISKRKYLNCNSLFYEDSSEDEDDTTDAAIDVAVPADEGYATATTTAAPSPTDGFASSTPTLTDIIPAHKDYLPTDTNELYAYLIASHRQNVARQERRRIRHAPVPTAAERREAERVRKGEEARKEVQDEGARRMREAREKGLKSKSESNLWHDEVQGLLSTRLLELEQEEGEIVEERDWLAHHDMQQYQQQPMNKESAAPAPETPLGPTVYFPEPESMDLDVDIEPLLDMAEVEAMCTEPKKRLSLAEKSVRAFSSPKSVLNESDEVAGRRSDHNEFDVDAGAKRFYKLVKAKAKELPRTKFVAGYEAHQDVRRGQDVDIDEDEDEEPEPQPRRTTGGKGVRLSSSAVASALLARKMQQKRGEVGEDEDFDDEVADALHPLLSQKATSLNSGDIFAAYETAKRRKRDLHLLDQTIRLMSVVVAAKKGEYTEDMAYDIEQVRGFARVVLTKNEHEEAAPKLIKTILNKLRSRIRKRRYTREWDEMEMENIAGGLWERLAAELEKVKVEVERLKAKVQDEKGKKKRDGSGRDYKEGYRRWKDEKEGRTPVTPPLTLNPTPASVPTIQGAHEGLLAEQAVRKQDQLTLRIGEQLDDQQDTEIDTISDSSLEDESDLCSTTSFEAPTTKYTTWGIFKNMEEFSFQPDVTYTFSTMWGTSASCRAEQRAERIFRMFEEMCFATAGMELKSEIRILRCDGVVVREGEVGEFEWKVWVEAEELPLDASEDEDDNEKDDETPPVQLHVFTVHSRRRIIRSGIMPATLPTIEVEDDPFEVSRWRSPTHANQDAMGLMLRWYDEKFEAGCQKLAERGMEEQLGTDVLLDWEVEVARGAEVEIMRIWVKEIRAGSMVHEE